MSIKIVISKCVKCIYEHWSGDSDGTACHFVSLTGEAREDICKDLRDKMRYSKTLQVIWWSDSGKEMPERVPQKYRYSEGIK